MARMAQWWNYYGELICLQIWPVNWISNLAILRVGSFSAVLWVWPSELSCVLWLFHLPETVSTARKCGRWICPDGLFISTVLMVCSYQFSWWSVHLKCPDGLFISAVLMVCLFISTILMVCSSELPLWSVCSYQLSWWSVHLKCPDGLFISTVLMVCLFISTILIVCSSDMSWWSVRLDESSLIIICMVPLPPIPFSGWNISCFYGFICA